jgi:hypothetical protein
MRTPRFLLLLVLALAAVVVAGCGGDDDGDTTTTTAAVAANNEAAGGADSTAAEQATAADTGGLDTARMTDATDTGAAADVSPEKAKFIEQADAICADAESQIEALGQPASAEELPDFLEKGVAIQTKQIEQLKGLEAPAEDADWWTETLGMLDQLNEATKKLAEKAKAGGTEAELNALADEATPINDEVNKRAQDYGLQKCGN